MSNQTSTHQIETPYLLFLGDAEDQLAAKTSRGIFEWRPELCVGRHSLPGCGTSLPIPEMSYTEAAEAGAKTVIIGTVNAGGRLPTHWEDDLLEAIGAGLDLASGLHMKLSDNPRLRSLASDAGRNLHDVRHPVDTLPVGNGTRRSGKRLLTVGTDCSSGKMFTSLSLEREMRKRGLKADFRATGQTGIFISGSGICVDAVVADFISGAAEVLSPDNDVDHWDIIEGQGSLFHPSFAGVSLGLIHGSQPDGIVLCHEPGRLHMRGLPSRKLPSIRDCIDQNLLAAGLTHPGVRCLGISLNTKRMDEQAALDEIKRTEDEFELPCVDPSVTGVGALVDRMAAL
jgi:uncharacterized NAD-dependent epimerase/dehydratase family protein